MTTRLTTLMMVCFTTLMAACSSQDSNTIKVGTIAGPETELMEIAKQVAKQDYDLNIKIVEFTDYIMPNAALQEGSIDANAYQHLPYLQAARKAQGYDFIAIGKTFIYPIGIFSKKVSDVADLPKNATVAISNDPSNGARGLLLLQKAGLIKLNPNSGFTASTHDIIENPKNLRIREIEPAQLPRVLNDVDAAVINSNYAIPAGLLPNRDAIFVEDADSPYANIIVIRKTDQDNPKLHQLVEAYQSPQVAQKANELFQGQAIPAWK